MIDSDIDFRAILASTWSHLGPQVGAILASQIALEPPQTPPKTRAILAPTWGHLGSQIGAILVSQIGPEPPQTPPKTCSEARIRPDMGPKWEPVRLRAWEKVFGKL